MPKEKRNRKRLNLNIKRRSTSRKQTQSPGPKYLSQMDKEDVRCWTVIILILVSLPKLQQKWITCWMILRQDRKKSSIAVITLNLDYDNFRNEEMLMSLEIEKIGFKIADAISLCQQVAENLVNFNN